MLDSYLNRAFRMPLTLVAKGLSLIGIKANWVTITGFMLGMLVIPALAFGNLKLALILIVINRIMDGLDGALARIHGPTDLGGYLDITLDFIFYSGVVFGFALFNPAENALAASFLIFSFMGTGSSFLAFAIMAEKRSLDGVQYNSRKSLYYLGGLTEGTETILFMVMICLLPKDFAILAYVFGALCWVTTLTRLYVSYQTLKETH